MDNQTRFSLKPSRGSSVYQGSYAEILCHLSKGDISLAFRKASKVESLIISSRERRPLASLADLGHPSRRIWNVDYPLVSGHPSTS